MGLINGVILVVLGGLCVPGILAKKNPRMKELLDKIVPVQGTLGLVVFIYGIWGIISSVLSLGVIGSWPLMWATGVVASLLSTAGGAIVGWGMIQNKLLSKAPEEVVLKAEALYKKILSLQEKVGFIALITGVWTIVYTLILKGLLNI